MPLSPIKWEITGQDGEARAALLHTRRGTIETPAFMPVGTLGTVKGIRFEALESPELNARIILGNTYHLNLRPGVETLRACGGLHRFTGWSRAILSDSGGFQVWSLSAIRRITEEGVEFRSHIDGALCFLSPETAMEIQATIGAEIAMAFDECSPGKSSHEACVNSMEMTARWAKRSRMRFDLLQGQGFDTGRTSQQDDISGRQALFGIIQGGTFPDLRRRSLDETVAIGFDGYALGGLSVGEEKRAMFEVTSEFGPLMPCESPRYLMGVGTPEDIIEAVACGLDMFDCVLPTRSGRTGQAWTSRGKLNIKNTRWSQDTRPLDEACHCSVCIRHSRAYLRHLYLAGEILASVLLTHHNLAFFLDTARRIRQAILSGHFQRFRLNFLESLSRGPD